MQRILRFYIMGHDLIDDPSTYNLEKKESRIHGKGLFTKKDVKKGSVIAPYNCMESQVEIYKEFVQKHGRDFEHTYSLKRQGKIINMKKRRNIITFVNYAYPNENSFLKSRVLRTKRDIKKGEEITLCYPHYKP